MLFFFATNSDFKNGFQNFLKKRYQNGFVTTKNVTGFLKNITFQHCQNYQQSCFFVLVTNASDTYIAKIDISSRILRVIHGLFISFQPRVFFPFSSPSTFSLILNNTTASFPDYTQPPYRRFVSSFQFLYAVHQPLPTKPTTIFNGIRFKYMELLNLLVRSITFPFS